MKSSALRLAASSWRGKLSNPSFGCGCAVRDHDVTNRFPESPRLRASQPSQCDRDDALVHQKPVPEINPTDLVNMDVGWSWRKDSSTNKHTAHYHNHQFWGDDEPMRLCVYVAK
ncbi:40S ribosomal protein S23 [Anopheles sinensis]|uniref:40S ribosomal protein S23 n=1 Tax=Anopheles sinensis TaxID=74873 RepID=A0A084WG63_ANOSI|nr:40S ribosomal protein S23 [Anopheles sinensis]